MLQGDGIYSRYLDRYTLSGRYKFAFTIDDNDNNAFYISTKGGGTKSKYTKTKRITLQKQKSALRENFYNTSKTNVVGSNELQQSPNYSDMMLQVTQRRCCGSSVLPALQLHNFPQKAIKTGIFRRTVDGPVIHIKYMPSSTLKEDVMPPAKIGDLRVIRLPNTSDKLLATWTAPGGDYNMGAVASYRFIFSSNIADLLEPHNENAKVLLGFDRLEKFGTKARIDFSFPHHDRDYYIGVYAFDLAGNQGKISNLVHIRIPSPPYSEGGVRGRRIYGQNDDASSANFGGQTESNWIMIGAIAGVIFVLLILGLTIISYYFAVTRKRGKGKTGSTSSVMNGGSSDETDSSSFDSDIKNIMANPLGPSLPLSNGNANLITGQKHQYQRSQQSQMSQPYMHKHNQQSYTTASQGAAQVASLSNTPSDHHTEVTSTAVTPVYWSASQLLSKLDHSNGLGGQYSQHNYGNPYVNAVQTDVYRANGVVESNGVSSYAPHGPHSLQPMLSPSSLLSQHNHLHSHQHHHVNGGLLSSGHNINSQHGPTSLHNVSFSDPRTYTTLHNNNSEWTYPSGLNSSVILPPVPSAMSHRNKQDYALDSPSLHHHCAHPDIPEEYTITVGNLNAGVIGIDGEAASAAAMVADSTSMLSQTPTPKSSNMANESASIQQVLNLKPRNITQV